MALLTRAAPLVLSVSAMAYELRSSCSLPVLYSSSHSTPAALISLMATPVSAPELLGLESELVEQAAVVRAVSAMQASSERISSSKRKGKCQGGVWKMWM